MTNCPLITLKLTFWMNRPSLHQEDVLRVLHQRPDVDLFVVYVRDIGEDRRQLGWPQNVGDYPHVFLDGNRVVQAVRHLLRTPKDRFHIFGSIWNEPSLSAAITAARLQRRPFAIYSEGFNRTAQRNRSKQRLKTTFGRFLSSSAAAHALAIAHFAREDYEQMGFPAQRIYPYGYFESHRVLNTAQDNLHTDQLALLFVGSLSHRKGLDILFKALASVLPTHPNLYLRLIGEGEARDELRALASSLGIDDHITFLGVVPSHEVRQHLQQADLLVLPSRWDGWGMVVNEAFSVGIPVIVSTSCGAADVVHDDYNGYVFQAENADDLAQKLVTYQSLSETERQHLRAAAYATGEKLEAESAVPYLVKCVQHMQGQAAAKPSPPWLWEPSSNTV